MKFSYQCISKFIRFSSLFSVLAFFSLNLNAAVVAHYSFDAAVGTDDSGNGLALTSVGAPALVAGQFGTGLDLNGASYLWSADNAFELGAGSFAISFWYQADANGFEVLFSKSNPGIDQGYAINVANGATISGDFNDETAGVISLTRPAGDNAAFQHVVFQRNAGNLEFYLNGVLQGGSVAAGAYAASANSFALGARNVSAIGAGGSQRFDGRLDEVWVYDTALNAVEINDLMVGNALAPPVSVSTLSEFMKLMMALILGLMGALLFRKYSFREV